KFREMTLLLSSRGIPLGLKSKVYKAQVRSCLLYGCETWAMMVEILRKLEKTEM
ncbi:hypothetical protein HELRODRAFT_79357, partial [Helobdella robusta]|uniref:Uncharacterized protein n=1 Tax=Helobdella robusta TaxID=6412 RepID=T1G3N1_HELRO